MVTESWKKSGIATKWPTYRDWAVVTGHSWQKGKRLDDEAEGLWRIYDGIYDLTDFIDKHPGGAFWLRETKGTDVTEAFEAHHLTDEPAKMMAKFKVRDAAKPRIYTLTLHEDGFYKTLKRRVIEQLKRVDTVTPQRKSDMIHLSVLIFTFIFAVLAARFNSLLAFILSSITLSWLIVISHNYFHKRDNWRMYTFNIATINFTEWRISHALSHHIYPNSYFDMELSMMEPLFCWVPNPHVKSLPMRCASLLIEPIVWTCAFFMQTGIRIFYSLRHKNIFHWHDLISLSLPLAIYLGSDYSVLASVRHWLLMIALTSLIFSIISLNGAHHDPEIYHEGDAIREDRDWGLFQVDTIIDHSFKGSHFLSLTYFGDHILHHLFPTMDHGILSKLYPVLYETLDEFKGEFRECNYLHHIIGQHKQLLRIEANPRAPGTAK